MKISRLLTVLLITFVVVLGSCEKSEPDISTNDREKFLGTYSVTSTGPVTGDLNYTLTITASNSDPDQIILSGFESVSSLVLFANVSASSLSIPSQSISGETYQGAGSISGKNLSIDFSVDDGQGVENRTLTGAKP